MVVQSVHAAIRRSIIVSARAASLRRLLIRIGRSIRGWLTRTSPVPFTGSTRQPRSQASRRAWRRSFR